jgi:hypothetical protein
LAELDLLREAPVRHGWAHAQLCRVLGRSCLPERLAELRPIELTMVFLTMERSTAEEYPTELFDSLASIDDCLYYMTVKRGRE